MGPHLQKNKKIKKTKKMKNIKRKVTRTEDCLGRNCFLFYFLFSYLSQIHGNRTVGIRRIKNESALRDEGYAWVPKTRDFTENSDKN